MRGAEDRAGKNFQNDELPHDPHDTPIGTADEYEGGKNCEFVANSIYFWVMAPFFYGTRRTRRNRP